MDAARPLDGLPLSISAPDWRAVDWAAHRRTRTVGGRAVQFVDYGEGTPLLLVHGMGGSWESWLCNIAELGQRHRVIAVDLPGFGGSDPLPVGADFDGYLKSLESLLDELGLRSALLFGHSLGGLVALSFAQSRPERTRGLVLVSGGGVLLGRFRLALIQAVFWIMQKVFVLPGVRNLMVSTRLRNALLSIALHHPRRLERDLLDQMFPRSFGPGFLTAVRLGSQQLHGVDARSIATPALVVWGREDRILPLAGGEQLVQDLPDAELVVLDDVGHCAMFEAPDAFNEVAERFADLVSGDFDQRPSVGLF